MRVTSYLLNNFFPVDFEEFLENIEKMKSDKLKKIWKF